MKTISEIRLENLDVLIKEFGSQDKVAERGGTSSVYLSQVKNKTPDVKTGKRRQMGDDIARKLEDGCGKERGWMDNTHSEPEPDPVPYKYPSHRTQEEPAAINDPGPATTFVQKYDIWTLAAIGLFQSLDAGQREAMFYRMREFMQYLGPPRDGQALPVAG